jgi:hypothetical protein
VLIAGFWREVFFEIAKESPLLVHDEELAREIGLSQLRLVGVEAMKSTGVSIVSMSLCTLLGLENKTHTVITGSDNSFSATSLGKA